jgi:hypothetical protein
MASRSTAPLQRGFEATNETYERQAEHATNLPQLKHVEAAGPRFVVANEGLRLTKLACHIHLSQPSLLPQALKKSKERFLLLSIRRESRTTLLHSKGSIGASWRVYNLHIFLLCRRRTDAGPERGEDC